MTASDASCLDTFFFACDEPSGELGSSLFAFEERRQIVPPIGAIEEVNGFPPFAIVGLHHALLGPPDGFTLERHPILRTASPADPRADEQDAAPPRHAPELILRARREAHSVLVVGSWLRAGADSDIARGTGKKIDLSIVNQEGRATIDEPVSVRIGCNGRGLTFAVRVAVASTASAASVTAAGRWDEGSVDAEAEIAPMTRVSEQTKQFAKELESLTDGLLATGLVDVKATMRLLKQLSNPATRDFLAQHPMRLAMVGAAQGTQLGQTWARAYAIPTRVTALPRPSPPPSPAPEFPAPQGEWDAFVGWLLPAPLIEAVAALGEAPQASVMDSWRAFRFRSFERAVRDLGSPRPLAEVFAALHRVSRHAVESGSRVWIGWRAEA